MCLREEALCSRLNLTRSNTVSADLEVIFAYGHGLHFAMQNILLPEAKAIYGKWRCEQCPMIYGSEIGTTPGPILRPEEPCTQCGCEEFKYVEYAFNSEEFGITGHMDGVIRVGGKPGLGIMELKSISPHKKFFIDTAPLPEHVNQIQLYMHFSGLRWGTVLYWVKGTQGMEGIGPEYAIHYDPSHVQDVIKNLKALRASIRDPLAVLPDYHKQCPQPGAPRAMRCRVQRECFSDFKFDDLADYSDVF